MTGVLITGGTGKTGSVLAASLRGAGVPVRVASRTPCGADRDAVRFDWTEPATFPPALRGMDRVYLVPPVNTVDPLPSVGRFLAEAERVGVRRVVLLGSAIVFPDAPGLLELAARVRARPGWVVLRASGFMQNFLRPHPLAERIRRHGEIRTAAGSGRVGWIDTRDIAGAAHALLAAADVARDGPSDYLLSGPKALSYQDTATAITARTGRTVRVVHATAGELTAHYRSAGLPADFAASLAGVEEGVRSGRDDWVSTAVLDLTGRPPRSFAAFVDEYAAEWTALGPSDPGA
ncbi:NAD-dependent epimerase/dehydratase family protein [Streptomyces profundus]|uniref:NAD-dependent epimerase/dehydratase family protein n=1 Tax=Streptomyces profundus TaxID=2867410 RepID=UPI001D167564|nr:NAD(P)H-binding protein [Streptomyces sp. MA3_2.13]UED83293.1 ergot alkaloid biosynthesis protein [Streptomyces sp. MA3_2.13]